MHFAASASRLTPGGGTKGGCVAEKLCGIKGDALILCMPGTNICVYLIKRRPMMVVKL